MWCHKSCTDPHLFTALMSISKVAISGRGKWAAGMKTWPATWLRHMVSVFTCGGVCVAFYAVQSSKVYKARLAFHRHAELSYHSPLTVQNIYLFQVSYLHCFWSPSSAGSGGTAGQETQKTNLILFLHNHVCVFCTEKKWKVYRFI